MVRKEDCVYIGQLVKTHGIKGEIVLQNPQGITDQIFEKEWVMVNIDQQPVPFFLESIRELDEQSILVKLEDIDNNDQADTLRGMEVMLKSDKQNKKTDKLTNPENIHGFNVSDQNLGTLGVVTGFIDHPQNPLIEINHGKILIPLQADLIIEINPNEKQILFDLPGGLIDL